MKRHVYVRGEKIPVKQRKFYVLDGVAYKRTKSDKRRIERRIELRRGMKARRRLAALLHEMIHQADIGLSERTVLRLEEAFLEMVLENPEIFHNSLWEQ